MSLHAKRQTQNFFYSRESYFGFVQEISLDYVKAAYRNGQFNFVGKIQAVGSLCAFQQLLDELYVKKWATYCKTPFSVPKLVLKYLARCREILGVAREPAAAPTPRKNRDVSMPS